MPCGRSDLPGLDTVKLYCPNCNDVYIPPSSRYQGVDGKLLVNRLSFSHRWRLGAFFGTTFPHLFFQTYRELAPAPYCPASSPSSLSQGNSPAGTPLTGGGQPAFTNVNPHGGQKLPAGKVYYPKIYGFKVSERARSGPRMQWVRMRPYDPAELDQVDWRGKWIGDEGYEEDDEDAEVGELEDFDPVSTGSGLSIMILTLYIIGPC